MSQEARLKILELLSQGKINAEQAAAMLQSVAPAANADDAQAELKFAMAIDDGADADPIAVEEEVIIHEEATVPDAAHGHAGDDAPAGSASEPAKAKSADGAENGGNQRKRLRIVITDPVSNADRVKISIPYGLIKFGQSIGERFAPELAGMNWNDLDIDIRDADEHVRIFVE